MPATEFHKKSVLHIWMLPEEILSEVLRHATWVPYGIDPSDMVSTRLQSSHSKDLTRKYRASLVTRRYLVRVCKKWHRIAFLYLYEWVLASRLKNLKGLVQTLERRRFSSYTGWCTKRLDINFRWSGGETLEEAEQEGPLVLRLLRAVPNLLVLTVGTYSSPTWIMPSLSHTYCPKLEFFNYVTADEAVLGSESWMYFVQSRPNLIAINAPIIRHFPITEIPPPHVLKELTLGSMYFKSFDSVFTSLTRLNMNLFETHYTHPRWYHGLITQPLPSLTVLQLSFIRHTGALNFDFKVVEPLFQFLPNLHRIDLVLREWPRIWSRYVFPSSVSVFGLRVCSVKPKKQTIKWLLHELNHVVRGALSPLRVQFLDRGTMEGVCIHEKYVVRNTKAEDVLQSWLDPDGIVYDLPIAMPASSCRKPSDTLLPLVTDPQ